MTSGSRNGGPSPQTGVGGRADDGTRMNPDSRKDPSANAPPCRIRPACDDDVPLVLTLIRELAEYERMAEEVTAAEADIRQALFGPAPSAEAVIAEVEGRPAGFALFFHSFSTFAGRRGLYLEDLYVRPEHRGRGIGRGLLRHLARLARERGCHRFEWSVLDWNALAIRSYRRAGAVAMDEWTVYRLTGAALDRLADEDG